MAFSVVRWLDGSMAMASICGFSFGKDLVKLNYPVVEAVRSVLPICDRFVFAVGKSDDGTRDLIASIDPRKVEIIDTQWSSNQIDGTVLSEEANKALDGAEATDCDWGFYIQADEVVHEADLPKVQAACEQWQDDREVKALLFKYLHFVLDYQTTDPWMYHKASRIVRLDRSCHIVGDACGPAMTGYTGNKGNRDGYLDKNFLGTNVRWARDTAGGVPARIFHYGWVKTREQLETKFDMVRQLWWGTLDAEERKRREANKFGKFLDRYPLLKNYTGPHPAVMADRIANHPKYQPKRSRWLCPRFYAEVLRHGFHG
jgi:hypothetical protein